MNYIILAVAVILFHYIYALSLQDMKPSSLFRKIPNIKLGVSGTVPTNEIALLVGT